MKDNFSIQSENYSKFRPVYPDELYDFLIPLAHEQQSAWDCGTGNGQVALKLANHFDHVYASDISKQQIANAQTKENITYQVGSAEHTSFPDNQFDLITVAQAIHWFDLEKFYDEVRRTLKPAGIFAVIGYSLMRIHPEIDRIIDDFYTHILGDYWDVERKLVDDHYRNLHFPFEEIKSTEFKHNVNWTLDHVMGFLNTWSAVQHYIKENGSNPVNATAPEIKKAWGVNKLKQVTFPIFIRVGRI